MKAGPYACSTSACVQNLPAAFAVVWRLICTFYQSSLTSYGMSYFLIPHSLWPTPFNLPFYSFLQFCFHLLPFHFAILAMILFDPSLLGLFGLAAYSSLNDSIWSFGLCITLFVGSFVPFISSWPSLTHLLSLGFLDPFLNSMFSWAFTNSFRLPWPNYLTLHHWGLWACHQPFTFFACITSGLL